MAKVRIYLDTCCLSRLYDAPVNDRIVMEGKAVRVLLKRILRKEEVWVASEALWVEAAENPRFRAREAILTLLTHANEFEAITPVDQTRANALENDLSFDPLDALHLAIAERSGCEFVLTTDDRFIKRAARRRDIIRVTVENPLVWIAERLSHEGS